MRRLITILLLLCFCPYSFYAQQPIYYPASKYLLDTNYLVSKNIYHHGSVNIEVYQANKLKDHGWEEPLCVGWIFIKSDDRIIDSLIFPNIMALGGDAGLFIPEKSFSDSLFVIIKLGDYVGKLFLIGTKGNIYSFHGGAYFLSKDKKLLFSLYDSDCTGIDVIDLRVLKSIFTLNCLPQQPEYWYIRGNSYYFTSIDTPDSAYFYGGPNKGFVSYLLDN
jgi:hypothetical protein